MTIHGEIESYSVVVYLAAGGHLSRRIGLKLAATARGPVTQVDLCFGDRDEHVSGHLDPSDAQRAVFSLPEAHYADMYRILQTEKPVFFSAPGSAEGHGWSALQLGTEQEPVGEGPVEP